MQQRVKLGIAVVIGGFLVILAVLMARFYWEYKSVNFLGNPERLTVNGRHFQPAVPQTEISRAAAVSDDPARPLKRVGVVRPLPGLSWGEKEIVSRFDNGCPTSTYLRVGPDRYVVYSLEGSC